MTITVLQNGHSHQLPAQPLQLGWVSISAWCVGQHPPDSEHPKGLSKNNRVLTSHGHYRWLIPREVQLCSEFSDALESVSRNLFRAATVMEKSSHSAILSQSVPSPSPLLWHHHLTGPCWKSSQNYDRLLNAADTTYIYYHVTRSLCCTKVVTINATNLVVKERPRSCRTAIRISPLHIAIGCGAVPKPKKALEISVEGK